MDKILKKSEVLIVTFTDILTSQVYLMESHSNLKHLMAHDYLSRERIQGLMAAISRLRGDVQKRFVLG